MFAPPQVYAAWSEEPRNFAVRFSSSSDSNNEYHFLHSKSVDEMALNGDSARYV